MYHWIAAYECGKLRHAELLRQAKQRRLGSQAEKVRRANRPSVILGEACVGAVGRAAWT